MASGAKTLAIVAAISGAVVWYIHYNQKAEKEVRALLSAFEVAEPHCRTCCWICRLDPEPSASSFCPQAMREGLARDQLMYAHKLEMMRANSGDATSRARACDSTASRN